jgi:hypothetical protein
LIGVIDMEVDCTGRVGHGVIGVREMDRQVVTVSERVRRVVVGGRETEPLVVIHRTLNVGHAEARFKTHDSDRASGRGNLLAALGVQPGRDVGSHHEGLLSITNGSRPCRARVTQLRMCAQVCHIWG